MLIASPYPLQILSTEHPSHNTTKHTNTRNHPGAHSASKPRNQSLLVVLVNFQDIKLRTEPEEIQRRVFGLTHSVASYFRRNSYETFNVTPYQGQLGLHNPGVITIELKQNHPNPPPNHKGEQQLSSQLIQALFSTLSQSQGIDIQTVTKHTFPPIIFVFAGQERTFNRKSGAKSIAAFTCCHKKIFLNTHTAMSVQIPYFSVIGEMHGNHPATRGIYAHELGHLVLGLPDLYKTTDQTTGINHQGLMGLGSWNYAAGEHRGASPADMIGFSKERAGFAKIQTVQRADQWIELSNTVDVADYKQIWLDPYRHREALQLEYRSGTSLKHTGLVATYLTSTTSFHKDFWIHSLPGNGQEPLLEHTFNVTLANDRQVISSVYPTENGTALKVKLVGNSEDKASFGYNANPYRRPHYFSQAGENLIMQLNNTVGKADFADGVDLYLSGYHQDDVIIHLAGDHSNNLIATATIRYKKAGWYRVLFENKVAIDSYKHLFIGIHSNSTKIAYEKWSQQHHKQHPLFFSPDNRGLRVQDKVYCIRLLVSGNVTQDATFGTSAPITTNRSRSASAGVWVPATLWLLLLLVAAPTLTRRV